MQFDGFVLAGGLSSRMGSDKALLTLGGQTLVERAAATLAKAAERVSVIGDLDPDLALRFPVIPDIRIDGEDLRASFIGLATAAANSASEWFVVLACDLPFVTSELLIRLAEFIPSDDSLDLVIPVQPDGRLQPLCAFYRTETTRTALKKLYVKRTLRLLDLVADLRSRTVDLRSISDLPYAEHTFLNVNTPADHATAKTIEAARRRAN